MIFGSGKLLMGLPFPNPTGRWAHPPGVNYERNSLIETWTLQTAFTPLTESSDPIGGDQQVLRSGFVPRL
jgi:hypothetical protein